MEIRNNMTPKKQNQHKKCLCDAITCAKCLGGGCTNENCAIHTKARKEASKSRSKFYIVPQTEAETELNRKKIEELRAKGLLEQREKTFRLLDDGTVIEENE